MAIHIENSRMTGAKIGIGIHNASPDFQLNVVNSTIEASEKNIEITYDSSDLKIALDKILSDSELSLDFHKLLNIKPHNVIDILRDGKKSSLQKLLDKATRLMKNQNVQVISSLIQTVCSLLQVIIPQIISR